MEFQKNKDTTLTVLLFIASLFLLVGVTTVIAIKATKTYKLDPPLIESLPLVSNNDVIRISGKAPKNATIEISTENKSFTTKSDNEGNFALSITADSDGKKSYFGIARKKILFFSFMSGRGNEVVTTIDRTSPNITLAAIPGTVTKSAFTLKGNVSEPAEVIINLNGIEKTIKLDDKNRFTEKFSLKKGNNTLRVSAKDSAGNATSSIVHAINYATGSVYQNGSGNAGALPNSAGDLDIAGIQFASRILALLFLGLGILGATASWGGLWLYQFAKRKG